MMQILMSYIAFKLCDAQFQIIISLNKFYLMSFEEYQTPNRGREAKQPATTNLKQDPSDSNLKQSNFYERREEREEADNPIEQVENVILEIQDQIKAKEKRLAEIAKEKKKYDDLSQEHLILQDERRNIKKDILDLDFDHERCYIDKKKKLLQATEERKEREKQEDEERKEREKQEREERERREKQEREERELRKQQEREERELRKQQENEERLEKEKIQRQKELQQKLERIERQAQEKKEETERQWRKRQEEIEEQNKRLTKITQKPSAEEQTRNSKESQNANLREDAAAKAKVRLAEIELELAESRLRRSRQASLQAQLIALRTYEPLYWYTRYSYPYYSYYSYSPYYRYSALYDPYYIPYSRYLYYPYI